MANFADLVNELNDSVIPEVDPSALPEPKAGGRTVLYPGTYVLTLPKGFDGEITDDGTRQIVVVNFKDAYSLQAEPGGLRWSGRLTNRPYEQTIFEGDKRDKVLVNDLALLLKALGFKGTLSTNKAYIAALQQYPGGVFMADPDWSAYCNPQRAIYKDGGKVEGTLGCGQRYGLRAYSKKDGTKVVLIPKDEAGRWADRFTCACGAELWVNDNLTRIRAKK
jgi:hypothetical protein